MIYEFSWVTFKDAKSGKKDTPKHYVQTADRKLMDLFLHYHGFDVNNANVKIVHDEDDDDNSISLKMAKFKSRESDKIYEIPTTDDILLYVCSNVACDLLDVMSLGSCALKCEIELFAKIEKLINKLDYVYIRETTCDYTDEIGYRYPGYPGYPRSHEEMSRDDDADLLYESLRQAFEYPENGIQPFTLETYVSIFTKEFIMGD